MFCTTSVLEKVSRIHKTYLLDQQLLCWRHFSKTEVVQNTDLNILALYRMAENYTYYRFRCHYPLITDLTCT